jgi:hypothetical protein
MTPRGAVAPGTIAVCAPERDLDVVRACFRSLIAGHPGPIDRTTSIPCRCGSTVDGYATTHGGRDGSWPSGIEGVRVVTFGFDPGGPVEFEYAINLPAPRSDFGRGGHRCSPNLCWFRGLCQMPEVTGSLRTSLRRWRGTAGAGRLVVLAGGSGGGGFEVGCLLRENSCFQDSTRFVASGRQRHRALVRTCGESL